jgi:hypothetical protein
LTNLTALIAQAIYLVSKADLVKDVKCGDGVTVRIKTTVSFEWA